MKTNIRFLHALVAAEPFRQAELTTAFIDHHRALLFPAAGPDTDRVLVLAAGFILEHRKSRAVISTDPWSPFGWQNSWRLNSDYAEPLALQVGDDVVELRVLAQDSGYQITLGDNRYSLQAQLHDDCLHAVVNGHRCTVYGNLHRDELVLFLQGNSITCRCYQENWESDEQAGEGSLCAPMNGAIVTVPVEPGEPVVAGQTLMIMEAMKMEHAIKAPADGIVSSVFFAPGDQVAEGAELIAMDIEETL